MASTSPVTIEVCVQHAAFAEDYASRRLLEGRTDIGALVSFTGLVRDFNEAPDVLGLTLEHYPGMTERSLRSIADQAVARWSLNGVVIVHRVGCLEPGDPIVLVSVASAHRRDAFQACDFIMDYLKTEAPFWKKERACSGEYWVQERGSDLADRARWEA